jgi:molecular chaperone DnaK
MASLKTKLDALEKAAQDMAQAMYQQQGAPNPGQGFGGQASESPKNDDDIIDAEFSDKN